MTDLDQDLEAAAADVRGAVQPQTPLTSATVVRRGRQRNLARGALAVLAIGAGSAAVVTWSGSDSETDVSSSALITSEEILDDGAVTEAEYRAGARAVIACLGEAGIEAELDFDDPNGHAGFSSDAPPISDGSDRQFEACLDTHLSAAVSLGWSATLGQVDLAELRDQTVATVDCVERRTGLDFGDVAFDRFDFLTPEGEATRNAAFEHKDHEPWSACLEELGLG